MLLAWQRWGFWVSSMNLLILYIQKGSQKSKEKWPTMSGIVCSSSEAMSTSLWHTLMNRGNKLLPNVRKIIFGLTYKVTVTLYTSSSCHNGLHKGLATSALVTMTWSTNWLTGFPMHPSSYLISDLTKLVASVGGFDLRITTTRMMETAPGLSPPSFIEEGTR
jgi:hypothetical protein